MKNMKNTGVKKTKTKEIKFCITNPIYNIENQLHKYFTNKKNETEKKRPEYIHRNHTFTTPTPFFFLIFNTLYLHSSKHLYY